MQEKEHKICIYQKNSNFGTPLPLRGGFPPKLHSHYRANNKLLSKQNHACASTDYFFYLKSCKFEKFVVTLHPILVLEIQ